VQKDGFARVESQRRITHSMRSRDQADRDAISSRLMRCTDRNGQDRADTIDFLKKHPAARRRVAACGDRRVASGTKTGTIPRAITAYQ